MKKMALLLPLSFCDERGFMFLSGMNESQAGLVIDATALIAEAVTDGYIVHLFVEGFAPTPLSTHADFLANEATFTGYASKSVGGVGELFIGPMLNSQNQVVFATPSLNWIATDGVTPNNIGGYWVENTANAVRRYSVFPVPVPMIVALDFVNIEIYEVPSSNGYAAVNN